MRIVTRIDPSIADPATVAMLARAHLRGVANTNRVLLRMARERGKPFPPLKDSHVEFRREPWAGRGVEEFADIATVYRRGWGDCDDLTAIRVAEEHEKGRKADFRIYWRMRCPSCKRYLKTDHCPECGEKAKAKLFHAQVRLDGPKGPIEDISRLLGM